MTTELTLRKLSKLISKIDSRIHELSREVHGNVTTTVVIHDPVDSMTAKVDKTRTEWDEGYEALLDLIGIRVILRNALGSANQSAGINHLVTELRGLEQKLGVVTQLLRTVPDETQIPKPILAGRIAARQSAATSATIDVSGYGLGRRGGEDEDTVSLPVLTSADVMGLEGRQRALEDAIEDVHDKLEQLNVAVAIELPDNVVQELQDLDLA